MINMRCAIAVANGALLPGNMPLEQKLCIDLRIPYRVSRDHNGQIIHDEDLNLDFEAAAKLRDMKVGPILVHNR